MSRTKWVQLGIVFILLLCLLQLWSFKPDPLPKPVTVPVPSLSQTEAVVFPSDWHWSGGPAYIVRKNETFASLPANARCSLYPYSPEKNPVIFSCVWFTETIPVRAFVPFALPADTRVEWKYESATSQFVAQRSSRALVQDNAWRVLVSLLILSVIGALLLRITSHQNCTEL